MLPKLSDRVLENAYIHTNQFDQFLPMIQHCNTNTFGVTVKVETRVVEVVDLVIACSLGYSPVAKCVT